MDPHAYVQEEFDQYSDQRLKEQQQNIISYGTPVSLSPDANHFSSSTSTEPASVIPVNTITDAPIAAAPMDATMIPTGDITAATVVPPGQLPDPAGGDCCGDCGVCGDCGDCGDCGGGDCGGGGGDCGGGCTIM